MAGESALTKRRSSASLRAKELEDINNMVSGKNILVTGGAAGLGLAFVNHFLNHGANKVAILDIDEMAGNRIVAGITKKYGKNKALFICVDVSTPQLAGAFSEASTQMNGIDIVINNAGILEERNWEREIAVNVGGMLATALEAMKHMHKDKGGHGGILVNVSEHINMHTCAQLPIYTATKYAVVGLSLGLAASYDYETSGVSVITLCPGLTDTALTADSPNKLLSRVMKADFVKNLELLSMQTPYAVAEGLMSTLSRGEHGSIWVVENGTRSYEVCLPDPRTLRRHFKNNCTYCEVPPVRRGRPIREVCDNTRTGLMSCV